MKISPIRTYRTIDNYVQVQTSCTLNNRKTIKIHSEYKDGKKETTILSLFDQLGNWVKSKVKYFDKNGRLIHTNLGERSSFN